MNWILTQKNIYFGNANAVKDYRIQLRGNKAIWFWFTYLVFLSFFAMVMYSAAGIDGVKSISSIQQNLKGFYITVIQTVQTVILVVAPILAAQGLVAEFDRKSIDLVLTSPVTPKHFFVGKLLSGIRQLLLLLCLSLPVSSLGVIMGGATWGDVFVTYWNLFLQGTLIMAFSLPVAMMTQKMAPTVAYVLAAIAASGLLSGITAALMTSGMGGTYQPFYAGLLPYVAFLASSGATLVFGIEVPNFVLAGLTTAVLVKLCLLGAGSVMSRVGSDETKSLRIHGLIGVLALGMLTVASLPPAFWGSLSGSGALAASTGLTASLIAVGVVAYFGVMFVSLFVAYSSCFSYSGERKHQATRWWSLKEFWTGRPGGGLPFLIACQILLIGPFVVAGVRSGLDIKSLGLQVAWAFSFLLFGWSLAWTTSALSNTVSGARRGFVGMMVSVLVLPAMLFAMLQGIVTVALPGYPLLIMELNPFQPYSTGLIPLLAKIPVLLSLAVLLGRWAEGRRMKLAAQAGVLA